MSFMEDQRHYTALKLADELRTVPREQHREKLLALLEVAELVRRSIVTARQAGRNRARDAEARGKSDYEEHLFLEMLWDVATFVMLDGDVRNENDTRRGRRTDNRILERMTEAQINDANIARREGVDTMVAAMQAIGADPQNASAVMHAAVCATAMTAYWHRRDINTTEPVVRFAAIVGTLGKGKQKSAPQVAALALAHCGYSNREITDLLELDPALVRRLVRAARVS